MLICIAAMMWGTGGFFAKAEAFNLWPEEVRGTLLAFWRALFAAAVLVPFVRRPRWTPGLVPMVLLFLAMNVTLLNAMTLTTVGNALWLQYTAPVWVFLIGVIWFGETVRPSDWMMLLLGMLGVGTILFFELRGEGIAGVVLGLLSGVCFAGVILSIRRLRALDAAWLITLNHLVTAVALSPFVVMQGEWPNAEQLSYLVGFGVIQMGIPYLLFARGLRSVTGHEASGIALLEPLLAPLWVWLAWHEQLDWWTVVGGGLILAGLLLRYFGPLLLKWKKA